MVVETSRFWWIEGSESLHCCFGYSLIKFEIPLSFDQAMDHLDFRKQKNNRVEGENLCETLEMTDDEMMLVISSLRSTEKETSE